MYNKVAKQKLKTDIRAVSSLDKVFPKDGPEIRLSEYSVLKNETFNYQVSVYSSKILTVKYRIESDISDFISVRVVETVPAKFAEYEYMNDNFVIKNHGNNDLFPDLLRPTESEEIIRQKTWLTFFITVDGSRGLPVGAYKIKFIAALPSKKLVNSFTLTVIDESLPERNFEYSHWIHCDCVSDCCKAEPFTKEFYALYGEYIKSAVKCGMTNLLTPVFTPPLDTAEGSYRKTVQLVKITKDGEKYSFDFSLLTEFIAFAKSLGIKYFELSHLATQHGAKYSPKIVACVNGEEKRIFGWDVKADDSAYIAFLNEFFAAFSVYAKQAGIEDILRFHISDELPLSSVESSLKIKNIILSYFKNAIIIDAVSVVQTAKKLGLARPYVCTEYFKEMPSEYVYYCGCQRRDNLPNIHLAMPSVRNRITGLLFYRNGIKGFLHWGFNFYYCGSSRHKINPFLTTDAGGSFDAGDPFVVYPADGGVYESLRHEVLGEAFADYAACELLEKKYGKTFVMNFLEKHGVKTGFSDYPHSAKKLLKIRSEINRLIALKR